MDFYLSFLADNWWRFLITALASYLLGSINTADMVTGIKNPLFENGFITVPEKPGLGFDDLNEEVIREHINPQIPGYFEPTDEWNQEFSNDRIWS